LAGDVLDSHGIVYINPLRRAMRLLHALVAIGPTVVLVGNHDYMTNQEFLSDNHWMITLEPWARLEPNLHVASRPMMLDGMVFAPYTPPGRLIEALDRTLPDSWRTARCVFAHQEVSGAAMCSAVGAIASRHGDVWAEDYPPLISGHIHTAQRLGANVIYPGSVISHSFGQSGESAIHLITVGGADGVNVEKLPIAVPKRRIEEITLEYFLANIDAVRALVQPRDALERVLLRVVAPSISQASNPALLKFKTDCSNNAKGVVKVQIRIADDLSSTRGSTQAERLFEARHVSFEENLRIMAVKRGPDVVEYLSQIEKLE
jgi:DNA repair exonuclease SbcCD nuclease subunit